MYPVTDKYREILSGEHRCENRLLIAGKAYDRAQIVALRASAGIFKEECPSAGNCVGGAIQVEMLAPEQEIPVMERMQLQSRIVGGGKVSEWIPKGTYFVNTRKTLLTASGEKTTIELTGFDQILKLEQIYTPTGEWPRTDASVLAEILSLLDLESDEVLTGGYTMPAPDNETCREILGWIAASYGGNWIADGSGKLKLLRLGQSRGAASVKPSAVTVGDILSPITQVVLHKMDGNKFTAGAAGRTLNVDCPWATQEMANAILKTVSGYQYRPFSIDEAICDPSLEIGDDIGIGIIYDIETELFDGMVSILAAPPEQEMQHKFPFRSGAAGVAARAKEDGKKKTEEIKRLVADVGVAKAGIEARVKYVDLEDAQWVNAHTSIFALAAGKIAAFDLYVKGISNGQLESAASLVADVVSIHGNTEVIGNFRVSGGNVSLLAPLLVWDNVYIANGHEIHTPGLTVWGSQININGDVYQKQRLEYVSGIRITNVASGGHLCGEVDGVRLFLHVDTGYKDVLTKVGAVPPTDMG